MVAWMNREALERTLETGRTWFWSRSRQEYWCKGETSGDRQYVREAYYDCDMDVAAVRRRAGGTRARATPASAAASSARSAAARHPARVSTTEHRVALAPSLDEFIALARDYTVVPGVARGARRSRDTAVGRS